MPQTTMDPSIEDLVAQCNVSAGPDAIDIAALHAQLSNSLYSNSTHQSYNFHPGHAIIRSNTPTATSPLSTNHPIMSFHHGNHFSNSGTDYKPSPDQFENPFVDRLRSTCPEPISDDVDMSLDSIPSTVTATYHTHTQQQQQQHLIFDIPASASASVSASNKEMIRKKHLLLSQQHRSQSLNNNNNNNHNNHNYSHDFEDAEMEPSPTTTTAAFTTSDPFYLAAQRQSQAKTRQLQATPYFVAAPLQVTPNPVQFNPTSPAFTTPIRR